MQHLCRQPLKRLLTKHKHGIFNVRNDISANRAHEGKPGMPHWCVHTTVYSEDLRPEEEERKK